MIGRLKKKIRSAFMKRSYSLDRLDVQILPYLNFRGGFFIEVGANDGLRYSNTLYFEKYLGWKGLLIEAIPALFEKCRENRPKCQTVNCALVSRDYTEKIIEMRYCNLMSVVKGGLNSEEEELSHIKRGRAFLSQNEGTYIVRVPARKLSDVLEEHHIQYVDLLSLDVEGYEAEVLKGIDFDRHRIEHMLIEARHRENVEAVIGRLYAPIASLETSCFDILYRRR